MAQQGPPPSRPGRRSARSPRRSPGDADAGTDELYPPWAGLEVEPRRAGRDPRGPGLPGQQADGEQADGEQADGQQSGRPGRRRRDGYGPRGRASMARARRTRRTRIIWGGATVAVLIIAGGVTAGIALTAHPAPRPGPGGLVTTFLPGEFRTVPDACSAVTPSTLDQYLPGKRRRVVPRSLYGSAESLCDWSVDAPPRYRLLDVTARAYAPSGLATGDGSATFAAVDAYQQALQDKTRPPKATHLPAASVSRLRGLGTRAFAALQVLSAGGDTTDLLTVVVRDRNVLVTVVFDGLAHSRNGRYGHVSTTRLRAGAVAAARDLVSGLH